MWILSYPVISISQLVSGSLVLSASLWTVEKVRKGSSWFGLIVTLSLALQGASNLAYGLCYCFWSYGCQVFLTMTNEKYSYLVLAIS